MIPTLNDNGSVRPGAIAMTEILDKIEAPAINVPELDASDFSTRQGENSLHIF